MTFDLFLLGSKTGYSRYLVKKVDCSFELSLIIYSKYSTDTKIDSYSHTFKVFFGLHVGLHENRCTLGVSLDSSSIDRVHSQAIVVWVIDWILAYLATAYIGYIDMKSATKCLNAFNFIRLNFHYYSLIYRLWSTHNTNAKDHF